MSELLVDHSIHHGGIRSVSHPKWKMPVNRQTAVRYLRFGRKVKLERLELPLSVYGRWVPRVPCHPEHLILSCLDPATHKWTTIREVDLPPVPIISGKGLSQRMTAEEMEQRLAKALKRRPHVIQMRALETDHLRIECDREHPTWPSHGETNGGEFNVPFGILHPLTAYGKALEQPHAAVYMPCLKLTGFKPRAPRGMKISQLPQMLLIAGPKISVGFSLRRPMLLHLGWDAFNRSQSSNNRLLNTQALGRSGEIGGLSGPTLRTVRSDILPHHWSGEVSVNGNQIAYRNLHCAEPGVELNVTFTVMPNQLLMELEQSSSRVLDVIEADGWRTVWDCKTAMTAAAAMPTLRSGRNGDVRLPMLWAGDGNGALCCQEMNHTSHPARMQIESFRNQQCVVGGISFAQDGVLHGEHHSTIEFTVASLAPMTRRSPGRGLRAHWGSIYSCFRPELGGFSNNAISCNCHVNQHCPAEITVFTKSQSRGPNPIDLYRFTIERALLGGGGYGYWKRLYLDSAPICVAGAGRIHQAAPNLKWLRKIQPAILEHVKEMFQTLRKDGLAVCRSLSGNSGSFRWSSNAYDIVGFGHLDAYVNAWTYRALRNATALFEDLGEREWAWKCRDRSSELRQAFAPALLNPETDLVAGWRSRDGKLHDYAFTWVNAVACAFGLLDKPLAYRAMHRMEKLRSKQNVQSGTFGVPANLLPIHRDDHMLPRVQPFFPTSPTFEFYTDGAMNALFSGYYIRALSTSGLKAQAKKLARDMEAGYDANIWSGGSGTGVEFRSWDGLPTGYEGTFVGNFPPLYAIAIEQGLIQPTNPEWWPPNG